MRTLYTTHAEPPKPEGFPRLAFATFSREQALAVAAEFDDGRPPHESPESSLDPADIGAIEATAERDFARLV